MLDFISVNVWKVLLGKLGGIRDFGVKERIVRKNCCKGCGVEWVDGGNMGVF